MYKQIFLHELGGAQFRYRLPKLERNAFAFKVYFWDLKKKEGDCDLGGSAVLLGSSRWNAADFWVFVGSGRLSWLYLVLV